jgi:CBS domain-containing protein
MRTPTLFAASVVLLLPSPAALAEQVNLPAPVLEWSFYILLIFAASVAIGIFFFRKVKNGKNESLGSLFSGKQTTIHSVTPDTSVTECIHRMNENKIGAMLVMENDELLGIFTERDAITRVLGTGLDPAVAKVSEVMSKDPTCVPPSVTLDQAMGIITNQRFRHLPVIQDGKVLGMVSSGDLTHRLVEDQSAEIQELVDIAGRRRASR